MIHYLNGKFVKKEELVVSVCDLGFARGYAVFDFLITYNRRPFMLAPHIDRLFHSAEMIGLSVPWTKDQVTKLVFETLDQNKDGKEKAIKIILSGGVSNSLIPATEPTIAIVVDDRHVLPVEQYENGIGVITVKHTRYAPKAKTNNYIEGVKQAQLAKAAGAIEPVYYDDHQVFETSNSNIFALIDGKLFTPASNMLFGITRGILLDILKLDVPVEAVDFSFDQLLTATEVFVTGSNKEILPVTQIDGKPVSDGKIGLITKEVMQQYREFTISDKW